MTSLIYLIAILLVGGSAVFAFLNSQKHEALTKKTYDLRVKGDDLKKQIKQNSGGNLMLADIKDAQDNPKGNEDQQLEGASRLVAERVLTGQYQADNLTPMKDRDEGSKEDPYTRNIDGVNYTFVPLHKALEAAEENEEQLAFIRRDAEDKLTANGKAKAAKNVLGNLEVYVGTTLVSQIGQLDGDIVNAESEKEGIEGELNVFVAAEKKIKELFSTEGISTIAEGKEQLVKLEGERKNLIDTEDTLNKEMETLGTKRDRGNDKLASHSEYFAKRKIAIGANEKFFSLAAVDFEWGFAVIKSSEKDKFFINQRLTILRGKSYVGEVVVSAVEPGRVLANIDYDSVKKGQHFHTGDRVILTKSLDQ